jgi:hypothetical protein
MPPHDENGNMIGLDDFQVIDADGNPVHLSAATILMCAPDVKHDYLPPLDWTESYEITGKLAKHILATVFGDIQRGRKRKRDLIRKKKRYRRARLKYGDMDKKTELARLMVEVAVQRLQRWKEGL